MCVFLFSLPGAAAPAADLLRRLCILVRISVRAQKAQRQFGMHLY